MHHCISQIICLKFILNDNKLHIFCLYSQTLIFFSIRYDRSKRTHTEDRMSCMKAQNNEIMGICENFPETFPYD